MPPAPIPPNEADRLAALRDYSVLDSMCEESFDALTSLAARLTGSPVALVSLVDQDRHWFKSRYGLEASEIPRDRAFCAHAILEPSTPLVVPDATQDARFAENDLVEGPFGLRFYAGVPLVNEEGFALGSLCVLDRKPREMLPEALETMMVLARAVMTALELRRAMNKLRVLALCDSLTGIPNRSAFISALEQAISRLRRHGTPFTLICLDLDGFKQVNDRLGHATGDRVLVHVGCVLRAATRAEDVVARLGGDEFAVLLPGEGTAALVVAERIRDSIATSPHDDAWDVTASVGAMTFLDPPKDVAMALAAADAQMYLAKAAGRNMVASDGHSARRQEAVVSASGESPL
jgi:diguanylate cyclase (GGDEF)-like protein